MTLRGKEFFGVHVGETYLGFTTELGKNWEVWMAYRELYCNAQDEQNPKVWELDVAVPATAGRTTIFVTGEEIVQQHRERDKFLLLDEATSCGPRLEILDRPASGLFYKGVRVLSFDTPSMFTYNILAPLKLTEDRTCRDWYTAMRILSAELVAYAPDTVLRRVFLAPENTKEHFFDFDWHSVSMTTRASTVLAELERDDVMRVNKSALRFYHRSLGQNGICPREVPMTVVEQKTLEKAITFCERIGFPLRGAYPILITESLGENVLALAERSTNRIFLTRRVFTDGGTKGVASTLIEEYLHLKHGLDDCTRALQTYLFNKIVSLGEELQQEPL